MTKDISMCYNKSRAKKGVGKMEDRVIVWVMFVLIIVVVFSTGILRR